MSKIGHAIIPLMVIGLLACEPQVDQPPFPNVYVDEQVNLLSQEYQSLQTRGYAYINESDGEIAGIRGIIIVRRDNGHIALDRNCSYQPNDACATVEVDPSGLYIRCPCCQSNFDMSGEPTGLPATRPLRRYNTSRQGHYLYITSDGIER